MSRTRDFADLINGMSAAKITSGSLDAARLSNIDSDYVQLRQATADLTNLNASNLTSGTVPDARYGTPTFNGSSITNLSTLTSTLGSWTPTIVGTVNNNFSYAMGRYYKVGKLVHVVARWHTPKDTDGNNNQSNGIGETSNIVKIGGLPFTSANTSQVIFIGEEGQVSISGRNTKCVVHANSTEIRLFGKGTNLDGSYGTSGSQGTPARGNEITAGNIHLNSNDGPIAGHCSFTYYTDTA
tara:strand:- start:327 stop:1046 length:720 start_codon:yes stop_codon:yes gene_type:complete